MPLLGQLKGVPFILDALAMDVVLQEPRFDQPVLLTPHAGEMAHVSGLSKDDVMADAPAVAQDMARTGVPGVPARSPQPEHKSSSPAHYLWAVLIARIYKMFPLVCPLCAGQMRIIAFITAGQEVRKNFWSTSAWMRSHPESPRPMGRRCGMGVMRWSSGDGVEVEPEWAPSAQIEPDCQVDQRNTQ